MNLIEYPDRDMLAIDVANKLAGELENALFHQDTVSFAVPGGTTPGAVFDVLCASSLDWSRVRVFPTDERWVPDTDERSNARLIRERLLVDRAGAAVYLPLQAPVAEPEEALADLESALVPHLPIGVLVLGMGDDMHTASLFPGAPGLEAALAADAPVLCAIRPETQPETRVSLSGRVLSGAMSKHLLITGASKRKALERAMTLPPEEAPIQAVLQDITVHWAE